MSSRIAINPIMCDGHGVCAELLPELITLDDWGFPMVTTSDVPEHLEVHARRARDMCPKLALIIEKTGR